MSREYSIHVDNPDGSGLVAIGPDDEIPSWARKLVHKRHLGDQAGDADGGVPPRGGPGSGRDAWAEYAGANGVEIDEDASRDDIIAALDSAGVPTE